jgi:hypothetical protein
MDEMSVGLLYDVGFDFDEKTGYLYVYPTEVGAKVSYDKKDNDKYYEMYVVEFVSTNEGGGVIFTLEPQEKLVAAEDIYVRYGTKLVFKELAETKNIQTGSGVTADVDFYTIGANPEKKINGKFYISKGAGESATVEFAMTGGKATVAYSPKVEEVPAVPSTYNVAASTDVDEATEWLQDVYNNTTITKKELYRYLVWDTSNYKDVSVSYQRIVPTIIPGTYGGGYKISYRFETVNVDSWDIISPYDYVTTEYKAIDENEQSEVVKTPLDTSYIEYPEDPEDEDTTITGAEGKVYAYGKVAENGTFIQYSKAEYDAQFKDNSTELKEELKGTEKKAGLIRAYEISFINGPVILNVENGSGVSADVELFFITAYDYTDKYVLIDYDETIVAGSIEYTVTAELRNGKEYVAPSDGTEFDEGEAAKCTVVITK